MRQVDGITELKGHEFDQSSGRWWRISKPGATRGCKLRSWTWHEMKTMTFILRKAHTSALRVGLVTANNKPCGGEQGEQPHRWSKSLPACDFWRSGGENNAMWTPGFIWVEDLWRNGTYWCSCLESSRKGLREPSEATIAGRKKSSTLIATSFSFLSFIQSASTKLTIMCQAFCSCFHYFSTICIFLTTFFNK